MFSCHRKDAANCGRLLLIAADVDGFEFLTTLQFYGPFPSLAIFCGGNFRSPNLLQRCLVIIREPLSAMHFVVPLCHTHILYNSMQELNALSITLGCSSVCQEHPWNLKVPCLIHKKPPVVHILCLLVT